MTIISTIICDRHGCKLVLLLFSGWLNDRISRHIDFCTGSGFTWTSVRHLLQFPRKLQICFDFEKWETSLYVTKWISVTMKSIQRKYFIYKQAAWDKSCLNPFRRFHKMTFCGRSCMIMRIICKKTTVDSFNALFFQINQDFPVQKQFSLFWRNPYANCYTCLKTRCVAVNAGAVCISLRCLATVSWMNWIVGECINISAKVLDLYI